MNTEKVDFESPEFKEFEQEYLANMPEEDKAELIKKIKNNVMEQMRRGMLSGNRKQRRDAYDVGRGIKRDNFTKSSIDKKAKRKKAAKSRKINRQK